MSGVELGSLISHICVLSLKSLGGLDCITGIVGGNNGVAFVLLFFQGNKFGHCISCMYMVFSIPLLHHYIYHTTGLGHLTLRLPPHTLDLIYANLIYVRWGWFKHGEAAASHFIIEHGLVSMATRFAFILENQVPPNCNLELYPSLHHTGSHLIHVLHVEDLIITDRQTNSCLSPSSPIVCAVHVQRRQIETTNGKPILPILSSDTANQSNSHEHRRQNLTGLAEMNATMIRAEDGLRGLGLGFGAGGIVHRGRRTSRGLWRDDDKRGRDRGRHITCQGRHSP